MKIFLVCLSIIFLSSCTTIRVDDFGAYWNKGYIDPALLGRWEMTTPRYEDPREEARSVKVVMPIAQVTDNKGAYKIDSLKEEKNSKDRTPQVARVLDAGDYKFLMIGDIKNLKKGRLIKGEIYRYKSDGGKIFRYVLKSKKMDVFLRAKYPHVKNIVVERVDKRHCKKDCALSIRIKKLDSEVYKILSSIPDTPEFWELDDKNAVSIRHGV